MFTLSLKEFVKTGRLGPVGIGSIKSELFPILGSEGGDIKRATSKPIPGHKSL